MPIYLGVFGRHAAIFVDCLIEWNDRRRSRSELMTLSDLELLDIGIDKNNGGIRSAKAILAPITEHQRQVAGDFAEIWR